MAFNLGYDMHDVAIPLNAHHVFDLDAAKIADTAQIVACQIHQHDMLCPLFGISEEFSLTLGEMRVGESRQEALKKMADRIDTPELSAFVSLLEMARADT